MTMKPFLRMAPACCGKVLDAPESPFDSKWCSESDIAIPATNPNRPNDKIRKLASIAPSDFKKIKEITNQKTRATTKSKRNLSAGGSDFYLGHEDAEEQERIEAG